MCYLVINKLLYSMNGTNRKIRDFLSEKKKKKDVQILDMVELLGWKLLRTESIETAES